MNFQPCLLKQSFALLILLVFQNIPSYCQTDSSAARTNAVLINRLNSEITFDGIPDEEAWSTVNPMKMIMHSPVFGKEPTENTDVRIAYDDKYLYVGAWLYYKDPGMIRSASLKRDSKGWSAEIR